MPKIIQNAMMCPDGTILHSTHVHDFQQHPTGCWFVDGGDEYVRRGGDLQRCTDLTLTDEDGLADCVEKMLWGTRGKAGDEPLRWVLLKDCTSDHLLAILKTQKISPMTRGVIVETLLWKRDVINTE